MGIADSFPSPSQVPGKLVSHCLTNQTNNGTDDACVGYFRHPTTN
jgi:hypothetical protein